MPKLEYLSREEINKSYASNKGTVTLLSFQSKDVLDIIFKEKIYKCDLSKTRESRDYSKDVEQLGGCTPVWCFSPKMRRFNYKNRFSKEDFIDGNMFFNYKCEISLRDLKDMNKFYILDLEVPSHLIKVGLTHNDYEGAVVIPEIRGEWLRGIYKLEYIDDKVTWYYPKVKVLAKVKGSLFDSDFTCFSDL